MCYSILFHYMTGSGFGLCLQAEGERTSGDCLFRRRSSKWGGRVYSFELCVNSRMPGDLFLVSITYLFSIFMSTQEQQAFSGENLIAMLFQNFCVRKYLREIIEKRQHWGELMKPVTPLCFVSLLFGGSSIIWFSVAGYILGVHANF